MDKVTLIDLRPSPLLMAKGRSLTKAQRELKFNMLTSDGASAAVAYLDSARALSAVNRKMFSQEKLYGIESVTFKCQPGTNYDTVVLTASTMGETWSVHNAWTKSKALHTEMQDLVLEDNPSVQGKWSDYKIFMDSDMRTAYYAGLLLDPVSGRTAAPYMMGEWVYSRFVMPQHDVDPATGVPLIADETDVHMIGATTGVPGAFSSVGLIDSYQESRSTVFPDSPNVPAGMADSFFNLLTDSGSQEPELAELINRENDNPPYDLENYPGGSLNAFYGCAVGFSTVNNAVPIGHLPGFLSQCGIIQFQAQAYLAGVVVQTPLVELLVTYAPGHYKGVAAIDMGQ